MLQSFNGTARDLIDLVEETVIASKVVRPWQKLSTYTMNASHQCI
jgi:hypothetical protein